MIVLDENISAKEEAKLLRWRIRCRTVGVQIATKGTDDAGLIPVLLALPRPIFFTHDKDFWDPSRQHSAYCLVWLDTEESEQARTSARFSGTRNSTRTPSSSAKSSARIPMA